MPSYIFVKVIQILIETKIRLCEKKEKNVEVQHIHTFSLVDSMKKNYMFLLLVN